MQYISAKAAEEAKKAIEEAAAVKVAVWKESPHRGNFGAVVDDVRSYLLCSFQVAGFRVVVWSRNDDKWLHLVEICIFIKCFS